MKFHTEVTLSGSLAADVDALAEHAFPGNHYQRSRYILKAVQEKVNRDKARLARVKR